jgi:CRP-like cAMP-binding protein
VNTTRPANQILAALPPHQRERFLPHLNLVHLDRGHVLYEPGQWMRRVFFPESGVVSLLAMTGDGYAAEVAIVGNDGVVGLPIVGQDGRAPYQVIVQVPADGYAGRADAFQTVLQSAPALQDAVATHFDNVFRQITQSSVCNRHHDARQRLARWLLMMRDHIDSDTLPLTQEFLGYMLGTDRKRITAASMHLQDAGVIRQLHGQVRIPNRHRLEQQSCECYAFIRGETSEPEPPPSSARPTASQSRQSRVN